MNNQEAKADAGKLQIHLVPTQIVRDIAEIRMYGNQKYGSSDSWKTVELDRYVDALLRHTLAFLDDRGAVDEESGKPHYKHMACNMAFICEMMASGVEAESDTTKAEGVACRCEDCVCGKTPKTPPLYLKRKDDLMCANPYAASYGSLVRPDDSCQSWVSK